MSDLNVTLTQETDAFTLTSNVYTVKAVAETGKTYSIAAGAKAYMVLNTKENSTAVTRYATITGAKTIDDTTPSVLGSFHTEYAPSTTAEDITATIYNVTVATKSG